MQGDLMESKQNKFAQRQLIWLLNEGDIIIADQPRRVEREFDIEFPKSKLGVIALPIYRHTKTDEGERPTRFKNAIDGKLRSATRGWSLLTKPQSSNLLAHQH